MTTPTSAQYDAAIAAAINADCATSDILPNGQALWVFGDATSVNGVSTVSGYGYPHNEFALQTPGVASFDVLPGSYGYGWMQVPNWSDGTYFWPSAVSVAGGTVYVYGERIQGLGTLVSNEVATFNASTLVYEGVTALPGTQEWGGVLHSSGGFWMVGTVNVTGGKSGSIAWVPTGSETNQAGWSIAPNVFPVALDVGTIVSLIETATGYAAFTKLGDEYGSNSVIEMTSGSILGPWTTVQTWAAPVPSGCLSYSVETHAGAPSGQVLLSYAVNGSAQYSPDFLQVTP